MLNLLDASFRVLAKGPAADAAQIASVRQRFATGPREYLEFAVEATEIELQHKGGQYIRIWGPKRDALKWMKDMALGNEFVEPFQLGMTVVGRSFFTWTASKDSGSTALAMAI
jgi:hypothetical protein